MTLRGLVTLLEANRPTVMTESGTEYLCYLRGKVRRLSGRILVGDQVELEPTEGREAIITRVLPRQLQLERPPVANVTGIFACFSLSHPAGNLELLDKRLVLAALSGIAVEIVVTKSDLVDSRESLQNMVHLYQSIGYRVWVVSVRTLQGVDSWLSTEREGIWVLTGESGVGKSSLLQTILPHAVIETGNLSRIDRGQQTTRWVRLLKIRDFWLADTPGYTALETTVTRAEDIKSNFFEWDDARCRFPNCLHRGEPGCAVQQGLIEGIFAESRYRSYCLMVDQWVKRWNL